MYSVKEIASYLKVSPVTIYRLYESKKLTGRKIGGQIRFTRSDLSAYLGLGLDEIKIEN